MNSYTYEKTYTYLYSKNKYITVRKYLIAKDDDGQRYAIFQFVNNYRDTVRKIKIHVEQYDKNNNLVYENDIPYEGLSIGHHGKFVPFFKLALDKKTTRINTTLVAAQFENHVYKDGKMVRFKKEEEEGETKELKDSINKRYNVLSSKSPIKSFAIISLIVLLLMALLIGVFSIINKRIVVGEFELNKDTGEVYTYTGSSSTVTIPSRLKNTDVKKIGEKAFMNSNVRSVIFESNEIEIGKNAFMNCRNLVTVYGSTITTIGEGAFENCYSLANLALNEIGAVKDSAFKNCRSLTSFDFKTCTKLGSFAFNGCTQLANVNTPNAIVSTNLFLDNPALTSFTFRDVDVYYNRLFTIFSNESNSFPNLSISVNMTSVDSDFLNNFDCKAINFINPNINLGNSLYNQWVNLAKSKNAYVETGTYIKVFDVITEFTNTSMAELHITDTNVRGIMASLSWKTLARQLQTIELNNYVVLNADLIGSCTNLISVSLGINNYIETNAFSSPSLRELSIGAYGDHFRDLFKVTPARINVTITSANAIPTDYFSYCGFLESLTLANGVYSIKENAISNCTRLASLYISPQVSMMEKGAIGSGCNALASVSLPYIGTSKNEPLKYSEMNGSYVYTQYLEINDNTSSTFANECFDKCLALTYLNVPYGFRSGTANIMGSVARLRKLVVGYNPGTSLAEIIGNNCVVENVLYNSVNSFPVGYFANCKGANVYFGAGTTVSANVFTERDGIKKMFITSNARPSFQYLENLDRPGVVDEIYDDRGSIYEPVNYKFYSSGADMETELVFN